MEPKQTRFRAYQLGNDGSSFSYFDGTNFTLIEARLTELSQKSVINELKICGKNTIDVLHITSWDNDHCDPLELGHIFNHFRPTTIEYPSYSPKTDCGKESLDLINKYHAIREKNSHSTTIKTIGPDYINKLSNASAGGHSNILYSPRKEYEKSNDNSTVKLFRSGSFTVLSLGDVESPEIADTLMSSNIAKTEVDVMILAHHGADNGFTTDKFLKTIKPKIAICSSNYDNEYDHPRDTIRELLYQNEIPIYTTKTGDVVLQSINGHKGEFEVINLVSNSEKVSSSKMHVSKRFVETN